MGRVGIALSVLSQASFPTPLPSAEKLPLAAARMVPMRNLFHARCPVMMLFAVRGQLLMQQYAETHWGINWR